MKRTNKKNMKTDLIEKALDVVATIGLICMLPSALGSIWTGSEIAANFFWSSLACFLMPLIAYKLIIDEDGKREGNG